MEIKAMFNTKEHKNLSTYLALWPGGNPNKEIVCKSRTVATKHTLDRPLSGEVVKRNAKTIWLRLFSGKIIKRHIYKQVTVKCAEDIRNS
jgi:hypothetical protein